MPLCQANFLLRLSTSFITLCFIAAAIPSAAVIRQFRSGTSCINRSTNRLLLIKTAKIEIFCVFRYSLQFYLFRFLLYLVLIKKYLKFFFLTMCFSIAGISKTHFAISSNITKPASKFFKSRPILLINTSTFEKKIIRTVIVYCAEV